MLKQEELLDHAVKFPLPYYLIQEEDVKILSPKEFNSKINSQLFLTISGIKYYKLFIHPDLQKKYSFLRNAYRYIDHSETEFWASPTSGKNTMVVWSGHNITKSPFMVTTTIDRRYLNEKKSRLPADEKNQTPETIDIIFKRKSKGVGGDIQGQQITELPQQIRH